MWTIVFMTDVVGTGTTLAVLDEIGWGTASVIFHFQLNNKAPYARCQVPNVVPYGYSCTGSGTVPLSCDV